MASNLAALAPTLFSAAQEVSAEPWGCVDSINTDFDNKGVAKGDSVTVPYVPAQAATDYAPAAASTEGNSQTAKAISVQITQSKKTSQVLTGEQIRSLENASSDKEWARQWLKQSMRTLRNLAESDCAARIKEGASRAYGTAGTAPFASDLTAITNVRKILRDNGAPMADLQLVIDTTASLNLFNLGIIQQAYQAGSDQERREGRFLRQFGFRIQESAGIGLHTKGAGASYVLNGAKAIGDTDIVLKTGSGTVLVGDVGTIGSDTNKYIVNAGVAAAGTISIGRPGLKVAAADGATFTIGNNYTANLAFERSAVVGVMRPPVFPANPTIQQQIISDEKGMSYLLLQIAQYGEITWELHLAYGFKVVQSEHVAVLLG